MTKAINMTFILLQWKPLIKKIDNQIGAKTNINLSSWGEIITVIFNKDKTITINSKCSLPTQFIDWGQNKRNVNLFVEALKNILRDLQEKN